MLHNLYYVKFCLCRESPLPFQRHTEADSQRSTVTVFEMVVIDENLIIFIVRTRCTNASLDAVEKFQPNAGSDRYPVSAAEPEEIGIVPQFVFRKTGTAFQIPEHAGMIQIRSRINRRPQADRDASDTGLDALITGA